MSATESSLPESLTGIDELPFWLRLCLIPGIGPERQRLLLAAFGLPSNIFAASHQAVAAVIGERLANTLLSLDNQAEVARALAWAAEPGNHILTLADQAFPKNLLEISDPPCLLYAKGNLGLLSFPALALVGARNSTPQGEQNAQSFAAALAEAGITVVSGLALGVDAAAHRGGLKGRGKTIAIVGTGADRIYPARNAELARNIATQGLILSEFALGTPPVAHNFPRRNRIISGLARGVLVVEAAVDSGSLITAKLAAEQGREVFAIPGSIHSPLAKGCHKLIKQGAKLVESAQDILEELSWPSLPVPQAITENTAACDTAEEVLLQKMGFDPVDPDTLLGRSSLTPEALFAMLTLLELDGRIARLAGGLFQRIN